MLFMFSVVKITVIDFEFGKDSLPLSIGQKRTIEIPNLPEGVILESDDSIQLATNEIDGVTTLTIMAAKTNKHHAIVARLGENGPILSTMELEPFWELSSGHPLVGG